MKNANIQNEGVEKRKTKKELDFYTADEYKLYTKSALEHAETCSNLNGWDFYVFFLLSHFIPDLKKAKFTL